MNRKALILVVGATTYAVSVADLKTHLNIETSAYDTLLGVYSAVAERHAEHITGRAITPQSWKVILDDFPPDEDGYIELPRPPVSSSNISVEVKYVASSGATLTMSSADFDVSTEFEPCRLYLRRDSSGDVTTSWPDTLRDVPQPVRVTYVTGYATVPEPIVHWIKLRVGQMIEMREPIVIGEAFQNVRRDYVDGLLDEYIVFTGEEF
jgi:uncharacterized phiE125 gp8 family phage protein